MPGKARIRIRGGGEGCPGAGTVRAAVSSLTVVYLNKISPGIIHGAVGGEGH